MKKTPEMHKKAKGTYRANRKVNALLLKNLDSVAAPIELSKEAKVLWDEIATTLTDGNVLTGVDKKMLMAYCEEMAKYWNYQKDLLTEDHVLELTNGKGVVINYMKNPKLDLSDRALSNAHKIALHFGLTPLSRSKLQLPENKPSDPASIAAEKFNQLRQGKAVKLKVA